MGNIVDTADGQQHVAGIQRAGGAGATGGCAHTQSVQVQKQALALDALEAEAYIAGQTIHRVAVEAGVGDLGKTRDQLVPQGGDIGGVLLKVGAGFFQSRSHAADAGDVFRACPLATLLCATVDQVGEQNALAAVQCANALGAVELVGGEAQHIDVLRLHIDGDVTYRLDSVGMEQHALFLTNGADLSDGQHRADLIIGVHAGDQAGILTDSIRNLLGGDVVTLGNIQVSHRKALFFQLLQGVQHRMMLKSGGNDVHFILAATQVGGGNDRLVVGFRTAGGEVDLTGLAAQAGSYLTPGIFQGFLGILTGGVQAAGVCVYIFKISGHGGNGSFAHFRGGRVIGVNHHNRLSFIYLVFLWVI